MASRRVSFAFSWIVAGSLGAAIGCFPPDEGRPVPLQKIYFPVGIAVSPGKTAMYVANSDFDLQFNSGTVQVYDLAKLRGLIPKYCKDDSACGGLKCDTTGEGTSVTNDGRRTNGAPTHRCVKADRNPCGSAGAKVQTIADQSLVPGLCTPIDPTTLLKYGANSSVQIGAFATDVVYATNPLAGGHGGRLFIPVRGDATLHFIDVDDDTSYPDMTDHSSDKKLDCGQSEPGGACDANHRRGTQPSGHNVIAPLVLPPEPYGLALQARPYGGKALPHGEQYAATITTDANGVQTRTPLTRTSEFLVTTHQTTGQVALFETTWSETPNDNDGPELDFVGANLPTGALAIAAVPLPALWVENPSRVGYLPSFLLTFRNAAQLSLVRAFDDGASDPARPFIDASRAVQITVNAAGFDSRGVAIDGSKRESCEDPVTGKCTDPATRFECLLNTCEPEPLRAYVANRAPASLLIGQSPPAAPRTLTDDLPRFYDTVAMSAGPSRVLVGNVIDLDGKLAPRVFIICFDSRRVFIYDPDKRRFEAEVVTGRGPHPFALDVVGPSKRPPVAPGGSADGGVSDGGARNGGTQDGAAPPVDDSHAYGYIGHFSDSYIGVIDLDQRHASTYGTIVLSIGERTPPRASK